MKFFSNLFSTAAHEMADRKEKDKIFGDIVGYDDIKRVFRMALTSAEPIHVLLVGPPASAKTVFLEALAEKLGDEQAYFTIGSSSTKAGMINAMFEKKPKYLMVDEIDKTSTSDQVALLSLMETGLLVEKDPDSMLKNQSLDLSMSEMEEKASTVPGRDQLS